MDSDEQAKGDKNITNIYIEKSGDKLGPFSKDEVYELLANGGASLDDLSWHKGLPNWVKLRSLTCLSIEEIPPPLPTKCPANTDSDNKEKELAGKFIGRSEKLDWKNWNDGGKAIFVAGCVAIVSMLMPWVDVGLAQQTGLQQGAYIFLSFWIYPILMLLKNGPINLIGGITCSIVSTICALGYLQSKSIQILGKSINAAAIGAYLFFFASMVLIAGVVKYKQPSGNETPKPE